MGHSADIKMKLVVCNSKFRLNPFGDGGSKRSAQIRDLLAENGIAFEDNSFDLLRRTPKRQLMRWVLRAMRFVREHHPKFQRISLRNYINLVKYYALRIPIVYEKYLHRDVVFVWENTNDRNLLYLLKATGHIVIGMPHNIESLVANPNVEDLKEEVFNLRHCDYVFAISKEETWLLRVFGVNAYYLPYYPPKGVKTSLMSIRKLREDRKTNARNRFLLLGSVSNYPTKIGMQMLIDYMANKSLPFDLCVAGYKSESLHIPSNPSISFWGTVTNAELDSLLEGIDAVLVYQPPTAGALTRIPEMLIAGIPVFVNFDAGRNYVGIKDVYLYDSFDDLLITLERFVPCQAASVLRDTMAESQFVRIIKDKIV